MNQHKPKVISDGMITISSNNEGIQFQPSTSMIDIFGKTLMSPSYFEREELRRPSEVTAKQFPSRDIQEKK